MAEPWKSKDAKELDNMTLQEWYNQTVWTKYVIYCSAVLPINMPHFTCPTVAVDDDVVAASTDNGCLLGGGAVLASAHDSLFSFRASFSDYLI